MMQRAIYKTYSVSRWVLRTTGLIRPFRVLLGPLVGRLVFRLFHRSDEPVNILGHQMLLASAGRFPPMAMAMGQYEQATTKLFEDLVKPGMVILDIGGHVGYFSLLAARKTGSSGKVYTFEPEPSNFDLLTKNIALNGYQNIIAINKAASRQNGTTDLHISALDNGRNSLYDHQFPKIGTHEVETITVDSFWEDQGRPQVGIVKIDVEGAEIDVLTGMSSLLSKSSNIQMIIEFNPCLLQNAGVDVHQFLAMPVGWGFTVSLVDEEKGILPFEGIDSAQLTAQLLESEGSVNFFCKKQ